MLGSSVADRILQLALQVVTYALMRLQRCSCYALGPRGFTVKRTEHDDLARACALMMPVASASTYVLAMAISTRRSARVHLSFLKSIRTYVRPYLCTVRDVRTYVFQQVRTYALPHSWGLCERCGHRKRSAPSTCARAGTRQLWRVCFSSVFPRLRYPCVRTYVRAPSSIGRIFGSC